MSSSRESGRRESSEWTLGNSFNGGQQRSMLEGLAERGSSEPSPSSSESTFISKLPPAVAKVADDDKSSYVHTKRVTNYLVGSTLGEGSFAKVKEGFHLLVGEKVAVKIIDKKKAQQDPYVNKHFRREARLLQMAHHPNILQLLEVVETDNSYYLITELCTGGELMKHIYAKRQLSEEETRKYMRQMVSAVNHLHQAGIIHRDLKVENLLLDGRGNIKIIDFGLSNEEFTMEEGLRVHCTTQCGSPAYAAPELLGHKSYGPEVDIWSLGVNMYAMLTGCLPYTVEPFNITALHAKMLENKMNPIPPSLSPECNDLLHGLLTSDPGQRIKMADVMTHPWITGGIGSSLKPHPYPNKLTANDINEDIVEHMVHVLHQRETVDQLTAELLNDRAIAVSAIYYLLQARLDRYNKSKVKMRKKSRFEAQIGHKDDDSLSTVSHPVRGRESTVNGSQLRPITRQRGPSVEGQSRMRQRRNTLPTDIMQAEIDKMHKTKDLPPVQKKTGTLPRSLRKRTDHTLLSHRTDISGVPRPATQLNPVRHPPIFPTSMSHPKDLNKLRHNAWGSQPPSQASLTGSRQRYPSNPSSRQPSASSTRSTCTNRRSCPEYDDFDFHEVESSSRTSTSHGTRKGSTMNGGNVHFPSLTNHAGTRGNHQRSRSHERKEHVSPVKRTNGHWSPSRQYEFDCEKSTKEVVNELSRVAETLPAIKCSGVRGNTVYLKSHSTKFQVHVDNDSSYGVCRLEFQWLQGGNQDLYTSLCVDIFQSLCV